MSIKVRTRSNSIDTHELATKHTVTDGDLSLYQESDNGSKLVWLATYPFGEW